MPATLISEDMNRPPGADFAGGYLLQSIGVMPVTYASQLTRATGCWGRQLREKMQAYNHVAGINMHGTCLPYNHNFLELSDETDETGLPKPRIYFSAGENEKRIARHGEALMQQIWQAAGALETFSYSRFAHTMGTCCMGNDGATAVVDAEGRSFDISNLYICDNSVFPDSLTVNPALTIMALSLRTADLFLKRMKKGLEAKN